MRNNPTMNERFLNTRRRRRRRTFKYNTPHHFHNSLQPSLKNENENPYPYIPHTFHPFLEAFAKCA